MGVNFASWELLFNRSGKLIILNLSGKLRTNIDTYILINIAHRANILNIH